LFFVYTQRNDLVVPMDRWVGSLSLPPHRAGLGRGGRGIGYISGARFLEVLIGDGALRGGGDEFGVFAENAATRARALGLKSVHAGLVAIVGNV